MTPRRLRMGSCQRPGRGASGLVLLVSLCAGCVDESQLEVPALDADRYQAEVQPFVAASCATLDCHGQRGRPLRIYSELGLRRDDALRTQPVSEAREPQPLSAEELADNVLAFAALQPSLGSSDEELVLSKPLSTRAGGGEHVGGNLFDDEGHPGYLCLRRWLHGLDSDEDSCADALEALQARVPR